MRPRYPYLVALLGAGSLAAACSAGSGTAVRSSASHRAGTTAASPTSSRGGAATTAGGTSTTGSTSGASSTTGTSSTTRTTAGPAPSTTRTSAAPVPATATAAPATAAPTPTTVVPGGWTVVSQDAAGPAVEQKTVVTSDGANVVLLKFLAGRTVFDLHVGSTDPPTNSQPIPASAGSAVSAAERPVLLGAFNGGFYTSTGSGGFQVDGVVLKALQTGMGSLVIDNGGAARVAVWGQGAPLPGESIASVRQNLPPLISGGQASPSINSIGAWGATLGGVNYVARSAVGTDQAGNLIYAASHYSVPADLSTALLDAGCVTAMELDINPEWVQADVAATPGAPLSAAIPGQARPADQYLYGWTRDFVTVQAAP